MLLDPRNGTALDLPRYAGTPRVYVIASSPRSGSTLLCRGLWATGRLGAPSEYLNPMQVRDWQVRLGATTAQRAMHWLMRGPLVGLAGRGWWSRERFCALLRAVMARRTSATGWFGLKIHHHHWVRWEHRALTELLPVTRWIWIRRRDRVAQAVSWARAVQTGQWVAGQPLRGPPVYCRRHIAHRLAQIHAAESFWEQTVARRGVAPVQVDYEALVTDWPGEIHRICAALGEPAVAVGPKPLAPQADARSKAWIARFKRDLTRS